MTDRQPGDLIRQLVKQYARGRSIRQIEREAGLAEKTISRFTEPSRSGRNLNHMPSATRLSEIADALGAPLDDVTDAFMREAGINPPDLPLVASQAESEVVGIMRRLTRREQGLIRDFATLIDEYARSAERVTDID